MAGGYGSTMGRFFPAPVENRPICGFPNCFAIPHLPRRRLRRPHSTCGNCGSSCAEEQHRHYGDEAVTSVLAYSAPISSCTCCQGIAGLFAFPLVAVPNMETLISVPVSAYPVERYNAVKYRLQQPLDPKPSRHAPGFGITERARASRSRFDHPPSISQTIVGRIRGRHKRSNVIGKTMLNQCVDR